MIVTLKLVRIGHARRRDFRRALKLGSAIQILIRYDIDADFQAAVFCRFADVIAEDGLEKC